MFWVGPSFWVTSAVCTFHRSSARRCFPRSQRAASVGRSRGCRGMRAVWALLLCSLVRTCRAALPAVDDASFDALVAASPEAWVLEFSSPRCGTCRELAPLYAAVAGRLGGAARFGEVDIDTEGGMALARRLDVLEEGVPNVRAWARRDGPATGDASSPAGSCPPRRSCCSAWRTRSHRRCVLYNAGKVRAAFRSL